MDLHMLVHVKEVRLGLALELHEVSSDHNDLR